MPFLMNVKCDDCSPYHHVVPNIVFRDIKWKKLKFRIEQRNTYPTKRHCRNLAISDNVTIYEHSVLHYDCYLSLTDGSLRNTPTHVLDVEATDGTTVDGWQFLFFIPPTQVLNPNITQTLWKPFVYVENCVSSLRLHIVPHPSHFVITSYKIEVMRACDNCSNDVSVENVTITTLNGSADEQMYDYKPTSSGSYYFIVNVLHDRCIRGEVECQNVKSPEVYIAVMLHLYIVIIIASVIVAPVAFLFYRRYCKGPSEIPQPPKVLVIYSSANSVHAKCVVSLVDYLRSECGFDVLYDGDITKTSHSDPYFWAEDAIRQASDIIYIVGPTENEFESSFPTSALHDVDKLLLYFLKVVRPLQNKNVMNVFFEHSNGPVPDETKCDRNYHLLRDWQALIAYLSRNLLPKKQIMRTEIGKRLIEDLTRVKKLFINPSGA
ncbi:uncharacterized protein LOC120628947 isoform X2 [Pararge aegeria]|nr:uncharacterized protein LOC120628947 isoform X2 [Pararge aegeria]